MILLAICDPNCTFTDVDDAAYDFDSYGGFWSYSTFALHLFSDKLDVPQTNTVTNSTVKFPYFESLFVY